MKILGIETSCDETGAAIVEDGRKILANVVASSKEIHDKTGGVIPEMAAREQLKYMIPVINETMKSFDKLRTSNATMNEIDAIAVTIGPGLIGSLLVGVETAKTLSYIFHKPLIPVNHIFAHIYANFLTSGSDIGASGKENQGLTLGNPKLPAIALVVSGGHTELFYMDENHKLKWIGGTLDDAAGEAFDKTARLLGLGGYPGGPAIAAAADKLRTKNYELRTKLPRPMIDSKDLNFSFSGLKTAVMREFNRLKTNKQFNNSTIQQLSYEIQEAITDVLVKKTLDAAKKYKVKSILLGGGVAANKRLKEKLLVVSSQLSVYVPPAHLCTDNAAYIASYAYFHPPAGGPKHWKDIEARPDLEVEVK